MSEIKAPKKPVHPIPNCNQIRRNDHVNYVIDKLGGRMEVAKILNINPSAVSHWKNCIPPISGLRLAKYAEDADIPLYLEDIFPEIYLPQALDATSENIIDSGE